MTVTKQQNDRARDQANEPAGTAVAPAPYTMADGALRHGQPYAKHIPDSSYQNYLFGKAGADDRPAWSDSVHGRAAIRLISRGIFGAAFFTVGGRLAQKQLVGYNQNTWEWNPKKPLQAIAFGFDAILGKAIKYSVAAVAGLKYGEAEGKAIAERALTFRTTRVYDGSGFTEGRSYGADIVGFTFDFAMASVGDATVRNIIQAIDPNVKKTWLVNDAGKPAGHGEKHRFLLGEAVKSVGRASWRILSKNQLEDWAAAIPYAFQMKFQRKLISNIYNKQFAGHELVFDQGLNGGAYRVDAAGKIVGDYQLAGAIDLHARFVGYNWYTLMFREGYDTIGHAFTQWKNDGFALHAPKLPEHFNPFTATVDAAAHSMRYVAKSFIKANMYMNPAVIPFWMIRVPQSKWRSRTVSPEAIEMQDAKLLGGRVSDPYNFNHYEGFANTTTLDKIEKGFSQALHPIGWASNKMGEGAEHVAEKIVKTSWFDKPGHIRNFIADKNGDLVKGARVLAHEFSDAAGSYTPYMAAKAETALLVDDSKGNGKPGQMDMKLYQLMDEIGSFNFRAVPKTFGEVLHLATNYERDLTVREGGKIEQHEDARSTRPVESPTTQISAKTVEYVPVSLDREEPSRDGDASSDKRWAESVMNRAANPAHFHAASATRH